MPLIPFVESPRFPENISYGSSGGPEFSTKVFTSASGFEQRNLLWDEARARYNVTQGIREKGDMALVLAFFYSMRGKGIAFRYKDWIDYDLVNEPFGLGDGVKTQFQLIKTYGAYVRTINKPVVASNFIIKRDTTVLTPTTDYSIDYTTGMVSFTSPVTTGAYVYATGEFDVPVRFDTDTANITLEDFDVEAWNSIPLVEVRIKV